MHGNQILIISTAYSVTSPYLSIWRPPRHEIYKCLQKPGRQHWLSDKQIGLAFAGLGVIAPNFGGGCALDRDKASRPVIRRHVQQSGVDNMGGGGQGCPFPSRG